MPVFPAWAGVDPEPSALNKPPPRIPRVGGGRPDHYLPQGQREEYSPRGRG